MSDRQYELVYILPPDTTEQQVAELHTQVEGVVSRLSGTIEKTENWGRRKLAGPEGPLARVRPWPRLLFTLIDRACNAAAWPVIQATSLWRGLKVALGVLRRQVVSR